MRLVGKENTTETISMRIRGFQMRRLVVSSFLSLMVLLLVTNVTFAQGNHGKASDFCSP